MKGKVVLAAGLILIATIALSVFVTNREKRKFTVPAINDISSIEIEPEKAGGGKRDELFFDLSNKKHLHMIYTIFIWLESGKMAGNAKDEFYSLGATPTYLKIKLKDGTSISIESAKRSIRTKYEDGTEVHSQDIPGQVTIYISNTQTTVREFSPELKSFIDSGWKSFFNYAQ